MRVENFLPKPHFSYFGASSEKDKKTDEVAREVLTSLPTIGIEPVSWTLGFILGVIAVNIANAVNNKEKDEETKPIEERTWWPLNILWLYGRSK